MNSLDTIRSALSDSIISNSTLKEALDAASFVTDRSKRFKDVALDDTQKHKLRRILNHFLVPTVQPKFVDDDDLVHPDDDVVPDDWLVKDEEDVKTPTRMIDVDTMNMVPTYNLGLQDQYCIVSHSWKGAEITYGYFNEAKSFEPAASKKVPQNEESDSDSNDVGNVVKKCKSDIEKLEAKINAALPDVCARSDGERPQDITTLLQWYADANGAEWSLGNSHKKYHDANATLASAEREAQFYTSLSENINDLASNKSDNNKSDSKKGPEMKQVASAIKSLKSNAKKNSDDAKKNHDDAVAKRRELESTIVFFDKNRELCYGIEALLVALQHIRSSRKILESIAQAKKLFDEHFPRGGKRYVWLDTCCINKADSFELTESLSLMGDWYTNADLCLVHLDTPRDEKSWIEEWKYWKDPSHVPVPLNMTSFGEIGGGANDEEKNKYQVEWATRGWTLQELVLSKVTYYVNSHWQNLTRPIEVLGPLYFLRPFLNSYLQHPYVQSHNSMPTERFEDLRKLVSSQFSKANMSQEQELTLMLQALGFVAPRGLKESLAESQIGKAVLTASRQLPSVLSALLTDGNVSCPASLSDLKDGEDIAPRITVFNHLLSTLASLTSHQILNDRDFIAKFSKVENMTNWIGGALGDSSASTSLVAASQRVTTVATDQAYSLMGILGVRFPAFPAEGLPKALARLLDEVVISYNDVSVFNWTGKHRGSPLHGRSLYPTNIDAFVDPTNNPQVKSKAQTSKRILDLFRAQRVRQSQTACNVNELLAEMLALSKKLPEQCTVFASLGDLATQIKATSFDKLGAHIGELRDIVAKLRDFTPEESYEASKNQSLAGRLNSTKERVGSYSKNLKFEAPKIEVPKFEVPKMSFGWKKGSAQPAEKAQPSEPATPETPATPATPAAEEPSAASLQYDALNTKIVEVIKIFKDPEVPEVEIGEDSALDAQAGTAEENSTATPEPEGRRMVCPNPITVSSGGIRGIFDIQRIIVTMINPKSLRARVRSAVRGQKIDGWCTVSTGLSVTLVAFSAERDVLAQQLDLAEVISAHIDPTETPEPGQSDKSEKPEKPESGNGDEGKSGETKDAKDTPKKDEGILSGLKLEKSKEQVRVGRMINFVQKQDLHGIAGEWVLARFSGVPGAKWFLSELVLGAGNDFYGRRIATDAFSFEDAAPEKGLTEYWHQFTTEKKARTCDTLDMYLNRQKMWQAAGTQLDQLQKVENTSQEPGKEGFQGDLEMAWDIVQNVSLDKVVNLGKMSGLGIGGLGAQLWADHLEKRIEKGALKRVPVHLRTPVRDLDQNRKLLPAMFHAGREMHMF
ncbi:uncharacterized protein N7469_003395 [Penicillium citrinum]|uniref:Heterokaryon incompatibility domain-containing protein n=1 Tax=Penicillium citrinum TaxID=5077 RepID=A0A9W9P2M4_PENCI|nr:uncharacterized protein N7469_003395 [Penicillium citrinum]KAJ5234227.1 hypothetical protein N7469_003395 [Penicillium citrinum]